MSVLHVLVSGHVQGVGFRWFVRERASRLGLAGWVRNRPDGSVEVAARGDADALATFEKHLWSGPPGASVRAVELLGQSPDPEIQDSFSILR